MVILTGPSGAGKDSILTGLRARGRPYHFVVTATTRAPRTTEHDGVDYYFVSSTEFQRMLDGGELLEHAVVYGRNYGVPKAPIRAAIEAGLDVVMRTDIQGARYLKSLIPGAVTIFVTVPSAEDLERRLRARGADGPEQIDLRLRIARDEMAAAAEFDHTVINDDLERCAGEIEAIMSQERVRSGRPRVRMP